MKATNRPSALIDGSNEPLVSAPLVAGSPAASVLTSEMVFDCRSARKMSPAWLVSPGVRLSASL